MGSAGDAGVLSGCSGCSAIVNGTSAGRDPPAPALPPPRRATEPRQGRLQPREGESLRGEAVPEGQRCRVPPELRTRRGHSKAAAARGSRSNVEREVMEAGPGRGVKARPGVG